MPFVNLDTTLPSFVHVCFRLRVCQDKTAKKINFDTFVEAVALISEKVGKSTDDVITIIVSAKGPT